MILKAIGKYIAWIAVSIVLVAETAIAASTPTITRDSYGVPTIEGGDFPSISRAVGQVFAQDRLWQMFEATVVANGRSAQYIDASLLSNDIFQRQINPTDAEVQEQIDKYFTPNTLTAYVNYVLGLNDQVAIVNANPSLLPLEFAALGIYPIPEFTLYDVIRTARFFFQQFSTTQIPLFQLDNLQALQTLSAKFGPTIAYGIFNDLDPLSSMIDSQTTMLPHDRCKSKEIIDYTMPETFGADPDFVVKAAACREISQKLAKIVNFNLSFMPKMESNGQAIGPSKSVSGNPLLRIAPQPNMNFPGDFYEVRHINDLFTADTFIVVGLPYGIGIYNHFGLSAQTGHLPTNDFLFESANNIISSRQETFYVKGSSPVVVTIYRSSSNGWVIENPVPGMPGTILTLRSGFFESQLKGLNIVGSLPFIQSVNQLFDVLKNPLMSSDMVGFMGQAADSFGNIAGYEATQSIKLNRNVDRRLPQGVLAVNPFVPNKEYIKGRCMPLLDKNTKQGYYAGWNTLFVQGAQASGDTLAGGPGLNRSYWLENVLRSQSKFSFDDLTKLTVAQAVANSITAFDGTTTDFGADMFTPLFKNLFLDILQKQDPQTSNQQQALALLQDFQGNWFDGDEQTIINTNDVSDSFILASAWLLNFAGKILNPFVSGTKFEVNTGSSIDPLPAKNALGFNNNLFYYGQGNLLARLLETNCDNTVFYSGWFNGVNVEQAILASLDEALSNLGGFASRPWGANKRPTYYFKSPILGAVMQMKDFNASGVYVFAEFSPCGVKKLSAVLPLGESGTVLPGPSFDAHCFDQLPLFTQFQLRTLPPFLYPNCSN